MSQINILLVEDSDTDALLAIEAMKQSNLICKMDHVSDGVEALEHLEGLYNNINPKTPDLILLDLNMPRMNGKELLTIIKNDDRWRSVPVVILSTSRSEEDVAKAYGLQANCYVTKPIDFDDFVKTVKEINQFWFNVAMLPESS